MGDGFFMVTELSATCWISYFLCVKNCSKLSFPTELCMQSN